MQSVSESSTHIESKDPTQYVRVPMGPEHPSLPLTHNSKDSTEPKLGTENTADREFAMHMVDPGLISGISDGPLRTTLSDS